jgi:hypothetical protein
MNFSISNGVFNLLKSAGSKCSEEFTFYLSGDLDQMSKQKDFLAQSGFEVSQSDVYPVLKEADKKRALELIYKHRVPGWWHYDKEYYAFGICTKEEFTKALNL